MKAENTLQIMMDFYGEIFYTRQKCLDHLFCTVGNGYEWKNGELIDTEEDEIASRYVLKEEIEHAEPAEYVKINGLQKERDDEIALRVKALMKPEALEDLPKKWSNISKRYSYICNYPKDIKPDWLALINECKEMLKADGIDVPENK